MNSLLFEKMGMEKDFLLKMMVKHRQSDFVPAGRFVGWLRRAAKHAAGSCILLRTY